MKPVRICRRQIAQASAAYREAIAAMASRIERSEIGEQQKTHPEINDLPLFCYFEAFKKIPQDDFGHFGFSRKIPQDDFCHFGLSEKFRKLTFAILGSRKNSAG